MCHTLKKNRFEYATLFGKIRTICKPKLIESTGNALLDRSLFLIGKSDKQAVRQMNHLLAVILKTLKLKTFSLILLCSWLILEKENLLD